MFEGRIYNFLFQRSDSGPGVYTYLFTKQGIYLKILHRLSSLTPLSNRSHSLSSAEASLCCGEAGEKEKESARGTTGRWMRDFPSSPARFLFFRLFISIFIGIPSGSLCGGEGKSLKKIRPGPPAYSKLTCRVWYMARISAVTTSRNLPRDTTFFSVPSAIVSHGTLLPVNI